MTKYCTLMDKFIVQEKAYRAQQLLGENESNGNH